MKSFIKTKIFWLLFLVTLITIVFIPHRIIIYKQEKMIKDNIHKIRIGSTTSQVENLLGWPDIVIRNSKDNEIPKKTMMSKFKITSGSYVATKGQETWLYFWPRDTSTVDYPFFTFDLKTQRVIKIGKKHYDP